MFYIYDVGGKTEGGALTATVGLSSRGLAVLWVQYLLTLEATVVTAVPRYHNARRGTFHPRGQDGRFGRNTLHAVKAYQHAMFGWADGWLGPGKKTITALEDRTQRLWDTHPPQWYPPDRGQSRTSGTPRRLAAVEPAEKGGDNQPVPLARPVVIEIEKLIQEALFNAQQAVEAGGAGDIAYARTLIRTVGDFAKNGYTLADSRFKSTRGTCSDRAATARAIIQRAKDMVAQHGARLGMVEFTEKLIDLIDPDRRGFSCAG